MNQTHNIYLVGPMGAGKTSVAKWLAKKAKLVMYDSDHEVEKRSGVSVSWIFEMEQEAGFRKREEAVIADLTNMHGIVLATGGGCVVNPTNRRNLAENGVVVYLKVALETQLKRTLEGYHASKRPLINVPNPRDTLTTLNNQREPLFREIAQFSYDTDNKLPYDIATQILRDIKKTSA